MASRWTQIAMLIGAVGATLLLVLGLANNNDGGHGADPGLSNQRPRRRLMAFRGVDPKTVRIKDDAPAVNDEDPNGWDYLIINYHKTGHQLMNNLARIINGAALAGDIPGGFDKRPRKNALFHPRVHDEVTGCPEFYAGMKFVRGILYVQEGPDFFCDAETLAEVLLGKGSRSSRGLKIVHLVRDPVKLAVSNYRYHSQFPGPEGWTRYFDVCRDEEANAEFPRLLPPILSAGGADVMRDGDFESLRRLCRSLWDPTRIGPGYQLHLWDLDPADGLMLATTNQLAGHGGDIARMAANIIKLGELLDLQRGRSIAAGSGKTVEMLTLATEEFKEAPGETARRFLDFLLPGTSFDDVKGRIAAEYETGYLRQKASGSRHFTDTGGGGADPLEHVLREHELFGRILGGIERLVNGALAENST